MAEIIRMPLLSDTMTEGVIAEWHKKIGDKVAADEPIADVETDKATMEVIPYVEGTLLYIGVEKGQSAPINGIIAIIGEEGEEYQSLLKEAEESDSKPESSNTQKEEKATSDKKEEKPKKKKEKSGDASVIRMPLLSDTMKEGKIISWLKEVGDDVAADEPIAEVETDKATMEVIPYVEGTLLYIGIEAGNAAQVNEIIAIVGKEGTDIEPYLENDLDENESNEKEEVAKQEKPEEPSHESSKTSKEEEEDDDDDSRIKISPLARKIAKEKGIPLKELEGSGDGGRIIKRDVDGYKPKPKSAESNTSKPVAFGEEGHTDHSLSQMRKTVARRLGESKFSAPHFYLKMSIKMDTAMAARKAMNEVSESKISFNDYIIKACSMALRKHPQVNSSWMEESIREHHHIHIGTAVAVEEGLIVPVIKFADQKSLSQIAAEAKELIEKARNKKLQPQEFTGNTFTVSNLGMMDIDDFTAIINPPDSCILAIGKINPEPVVENGEIVIRHILRLSLSCDHRVVDGAVGAAFLQTLKSYLENPVNMLV